MNCSARAATLEEIQPWREMYRREMACQIIHDSIHTRPGWTREFVLLAGTVRVGYGSLAVAGPWQATPTLYEWYVAPPHRTRLFDLFPALLAASGARRIETQSNDVLLTVMLHAFAASVTSESILFQDQVTTDWKVPGVEVRRARPEYTAHVALLGLDADADWVLVQEGGVVATGGILFHYNRPYGDLYMKVAEGHRRRGLGSYLVQELKRICYEQGNVPGARCQVANVASRRTLQRAGFVPCGHILVGTLPD